MGEYHRSILSDMDERTTVFTVEPGKALEDVAQSGTIRVGQEVMSIVEFQHNAIGIDVVGTGGGFGSWCAPDAALADLGARRPKIVNASREIKPEELERCSAFGITPIEFRVGTDALAITVSADNTFVDELSIAELRQIFGGAETWTQVRPEWPDVPIQLVIPGEYSGTYDFFIDAVFDGDVSALRAQGAITSENDNQLVGSISRNRFSIGFFGYAYYLANSDDLRIVPLDGIRPSAETVEDGSYSLARPLFIYSDAGICAIIGKSLTLSFITWITPATSSSMSVTSRHPRRRLPKRATTGYVQPTPAMRRLSTLRKPAAKLLSPAARRFSR